MRSGIAVGGRLARRRDARRTAILRAAAQVFRARGFGAATMREIGEAADLSPANLYYYFRGKDELLFFCQDQALSRMVAAVEAARQETSDPVARLVQVFEAHARILLDDVDGGIAHLQIDALTPSHR